MLPMPSFTLFGKMVSQKGNKYIPGDGATQKPPDRFVIVKDIIVILSILSDI